MKSKLIIIVGFLTAVLVIIGITLSSLQKKGESGGPEVSTGGPPPPPAPPCEISMLYSSEKKEWIEAAAQRFQKEHPEIKVNLMAQGSLDAAQAIVDGRQKPTIFSPADSLVKNLLASDWETKYGKPLFEPKGEDEPQPLVTTPLVFVVWEDRAEKLLKASGNTISWKSIHKAVKSNEGWKAIQGDPAWGFVKLGHSDPTRSNSGLQALLLMTLEYYAKNSGLAVGDLLDSKYQEFVSEVEKGVGQFESSSGTFMTEMIRFGPSKYDIAVVYENLAISEFDKAKGRWGNLKVYYPNPTLWSDHPVILLSGEWVSEAQKKAARVWISYLRSRPIQETALLYGFRPADTSVPLKTSDDRNPFTRLAAQGIKLEIPAAAHPPDGQVIRNLMMMWSRVVQK